MSQKELGRVEVLARVGSGELRVVDAGQLMQVSYRQAKRLWKRYREGGPEGLQHGNAGRASNRCHAQKFRVRVLRLVREKYGGAVGERFGPTLAAEAEPLASEDRLRVKAEALRRWMLQEGLWSRERRVVSEDRVVRYENRYFQLQRRGGSAPARGRVLVCAGWQGQISIEYRGRGLDWREIAAPVRPQATERAVRGVSGVPIAYGQRKWTPPAGHPWKQAAERAARQKALREAAAATRASLAYPSASP